MMLVFGKEGKAIHHIIVEFYSCIFIQEY